MSATDRDTARTLLRGWRAAVNGAQRGPSPAVEAALAYAMLDLADAIRGGGESDARAHDRGPGQPVR